MTGASAKLRDWSDRFSKTPLAASVVSGLEKRAAEIWEHAFKMLQQESPEYRNSVDEKFTDESKSHCKELLQLIVAVARGGAGPERADPFAFVRTHAAWRARQSVPLIASLHAYRLAHRTYAGITKEILQRHSKRDEALDSLAMLSDFWIEFFDHVGFVLAEAHAVEEGLTAAEKTPLYAGLIDDLLRGKQPSEGDLQVMAVCGMERGAPLAVAMARPLPSDHGRGQVEPTLRAIVRLIQQELPSPEFGKLVAIRGDEVAMIVSSRLDPDRGLAKFLRRRAFPRKQVSPAAVVGVSRDAAELTDIPEALREARLALEFASATKKLVHFADIPLTEFLITRADKAALRLVPDWARQFCDGDNQARELARTLRMFAECSLNVKQTARRLSLHTNTVYFRLNQVEQMTGVDPRTFSGLMLLTTALTLAEPERPRNL